MRCVSKIALLLPKTALLLLILNGTSKAGAMDKQKDPSKAVLPSRAEFMKRVREIVHPGLADAAARLPPGGNDPAVPETEPEPGVLTPDDPLHTGPMPDPSVPAPAPDPVGGEERADPPIRDGAAAAAEDDKYEVRRIKDASDPASFLDAGEEDLGRNRYDRGDCPQWAEGHGFKQRNVGCTANFVYVRSKNIAWSDSKDYWLTVGRANPAHATSAWSRFLPNPDTRWGGSKRYQYIVMWWTFADRPEPDRVVWRCGSHTYHSDLLGEENRQYSETWTEETTDMAVYFTGSGSVCWYWTWPEWTPYEHPNSHHDSFVGVDPE